MTETDAGSDAGVPRRRLPIGIQTFRIIREEGYYYVDKTAHVRRLLDEGTHYFLSRPRRFGKSLLLDTVKELFEGAEPLFRGLAIHERWDWSVRHPVVRLSFGSGNFKDPDYLAANLAAQLDELERRADAASGYAAGPDRFARLLRTLHERAGRRVAVLVDEYDKPILDALDAPDMARANRDFLRGLYSVVKDCDAHVRFALLTGVSKFSKVSLFSGLPPARPSAATPRPTSTRCSHRSCRVSTGTRSAAGTTATTGWATRKCTTRSTSCCCSAAAGSGPGGSKREPRRF